MTVWPWVGVGSWLGVDPIGAAAPSRGGIVAAVSGCDVVAAGGVSGIGRRGLAATVRPSYCQRCPDSPTLNTPGSLPCSVSAGSPLLPTCQRSPWLVRGRCELVAVGVAGCGFGVDFPPVGFLKKNRLPLQNPYKLLCVNKLCLQR